MDDLIRKAVELADNFAVHDDREFRVLTNHGMFYVDYDEQFFLDALAGQLVRQVDERKVANVYIVPEMTEVQTARMAD